MFKGFEKKNWNLFITNLISVIFIIIIAFNDNIRTQAQIKRRFYDEYFNVPVAAMTAFLQLTTIFFASSSLYNTSDRNHSNYYAYGR